MTSIASQAPISAVSTPQVSLLRLYILRAAGYVFATYVLQPARPLEVVFHRNSYRARAEFKRLRDKCKIILENDQVRVLEYAPP
jgi:hypothetical protein